MTNANHKPVSLDDCGADNWNMDEAPASIVNPDASLHRCIAWCWSEVDSLSRLAAGVVGVDSVLLSDAVNELLAKKLSVLAVMLECLAERTNNSG